MRILFGIIIGIMIAESSQRLATTLAPSPRSLQGSRIETAIQVDQTGSEYQHGAHCMDERVF